MNREERRRKAAIERSNKLVDNYVRHLPEISPEAANSPGVHHIVVEHDDWCALLSGKGKACTCSPNVKYYDDRKRS